MTTLEKIKNLDGFSNVKSFFKDNDITKLNREELYALTIKMAELNATQQLDAYFKLVFDALVRHGEGFRYWVPILISNVIALAALVVSLTVGKCS